MEKKHKLKEQLLIELKDRVKKPFIPTLSDAIDKLREIRNKDINMDDKEFCFFLGIAFCFNLLPDELVINFVNSKDNITSS